MRYLFALSMALALGVTTGNAAVIDSVALSGVGTFGTNSFSINNSLTDSGVTFDVDYTFTATNGGSPANLSFTPAGVGVIGGSSDGLNVGDTLLVSVAVSNVTGGTVDSISFSNLATVGTTSGTPTFTGAGPTSTTLVGLTGDDYRVASFSTTFNATAVPEPGSFAALAFVGMGLVLRRRRRSIAI